MTRISVCHERWRGRQRCCVEDGRRPSGVVLQGKAPNHLMLLRSKGVVVSDEEKAAISCQVSEEKMSASEPLMTHRKGSKTLPEGVSGNSARRSVDGACLRATRQPVHRRHDLVTGFSMERGNLTRGGKGNRRVANTTSENTNTRGRGGATRSSEEVAVMVMERRGRVIRPEFACQPVLPGGA